MSGKKKKALILGVTGQDGSYLADILIEKGYEVHGMIRKSATGNTININHLINDKTIFNNKLFLHRGDMLDPTSLYRIISSVRPNEIYNEADQDHVRWSYDMVGYSSDITASAVAKLFEIIRQIDTEIKVFQPCTSNMYGILDSGSICENTVFNPQSPYAIAKTFAYYTARYYRNAYNMKISTGILFNHESPRRTVDYVTRKISSSVAKIALGMEDKLVLGDLTAKIDWGYARDYMECAWTMLQREEADDYVVSTGLTHSVRDFVDHAFKLVNLNPENYIETSEEFIRPTKTSELCGDSTKARLILDFKPKVSFQGLVEMMVNHDLKINKIHAG
jgi:GDPmannose 4,6-dehydratase